MSLRDLVPTSGILGLRPARVAGTSEDDRAAGPVPGSGGFHRGEPGLGARRAALEQSGFTDIFESVSDHINVNARSSERLHVLMSGLLNA